MAFLEELGRTITDTGKEVATKAKALTETLQLKSQITAEKTKLEEAYAVIGKNYYNSNREPGEGYEKTFEAVKAIRERIAGLEADLIQSEGSRICAVCGAKVSKDSLYCGKCGTPIKEEAAESGTAESEAADQATAQEVNPAINQAAGQEAQQANLQTADHCSRVPEASEDAFVASDDGRE